MRVWESKAWGVLLDQSSDPASPLGRTPIVKRLQIDYDVIYMCYDRLLVPDKKLRLGLKLKPSKSCLLLLLLYSSQNTAGIPIIRAKIHNGRCAKSAH